MRVSGYLFLLEQWLAALCLLSATGAAAALPQPRLPAMMLASLLDALASLLCALYPVLPLRLMTLSLMLLSPLALWPRLPRRLRRRIPLVALLLSLLMTGSMRLLYGLPGLPGLLLSCGGLLLVPRLQPRPATPCCISVDIRKGSCRVVLTGLVDTGNLLRDPLTGLPVVVISRAAAIHLTDLPPAGQLTPGMRLISVKTVSGTGLMTIFRPDGLRLMQGASWRSAQAMIGVSPDGYDGAQALVPASLLSAEPPTILSQGG